MAAHRDERQLATTQAPSGLAVIKLLRDNKNKVYAQLSYNEVEVYNPALPALCVVSFNAGNHYHTFKNTWLQVQALYDLGFHEIIFALTADNYITCQINPNASIEKIIWVRDIYWPLKISAKRSYTDLRLGLMSWNHFLPPDHEAINTIEALYTTEGPFRQRIKSYIKKRLQADKKRKKLKRNNQLDQSNVPNQRENFKKFILREIAAELAIWGSPEHPVEQKYGCICYPFKTGGSDPYIALVKAAGITHFPYVVARKYRKTLRTRSTSMEGFEEYSSVSECHDHSSQSSCSASQKILFPRSKPTQEPDNKAGVRPASTPPKGSPPQNSTDTSGSGSKSRRKSSNDMPSSDVNLPVFVKDPATSSSVSSQEGDTLHRPVATKMSNQGEQYLSTTSLTPTTSPTDVTSASGNTVLMVRSQGDDPTVSRTTSTFDSDDERDVKNQNSSMSQSTYAELKTLIMQQRSEVKQTLCSIPTQHSFKTAYKRDLNTKVVCAVVTITQFLRNHRAKINPSMVDTFCDMLEELYAEDQDEKIHPHDEEEQATQFECICENMLDHL